MCFFIAGVQPRRRTMDNTPRRCPRCGLHQAYQVRIDHYVSLFFIPLIPVKRGESFLFCNRCQVPVGEKTYGQATEATHGEISTCTRCGRHLNPGYTYCPFCGQRR